MNGAGVSRCDRSPIVHLAPAMPQLGAVDLVVRPLQEALEHPELVEDLHVEGWTVSPRKSRKKSACFSSTWTLQPARANSSPAIIPAGPPPTTIRSSRHRLVTP